MYEAEYTTALMQYTNRIYHLLLYRCICGSDSSDFCISGIGGKVYGKDQLDSDTNGVNISIFNGWNRERIIG